MYSKYLKCDECGDVLDRRPKDDFGNQGRGTFALGEWPQLLDYAKSIGWTIVGDGHDGRHTCPKHSLTMTEGITWSDRIANLTRALGRKPTLAEMLDASAVQQMTPAEVEAQRQSWIRGMCTPCEHGELDFEQCPQCRGRKR